MIGFVRRYRGNLPVLFITIAVTIAVTTLMLMVNQETILLRNSDQSPPGVRCQQRGLLGRDSDMLDRDLTHQLLYQVLRRLNSSKPLINVNITNVIHQDVAANENLINLLKNHLQGGAGVKKPKNETLLDHFKPIMNLAEKDALYDAFLTLAQVSQVNNFTYMMYSGTLLGSYRHHDMVPWDDDFDVFMKYDQRSAIIDALMQLSPNYEVIKAGSRVKFFSTVGTQTSKYPWKWPYLDISFFKENATHIWDGSMEDDYGDRLYLYPKDIVFPLHKRPLGQHFFDAPRDSYSHLKRTYGTGMLDACYTSHYSHKFEELNSKTYKIDCKELAYLYPFVYRSPDKNGVRETLRLGDKTIQGMIVPEPKYAVAQPFKVDLYKTP